MSRGIDKKQNVVLLKCMSRVFLKSTSSLCDMSSIRGAIKNINGKSWEIVSTSSV